MLHRIRLFAGIVMTAWLLTFASERHALFSLRGWLDTAAYVEIDQKRATEPGFQTPAPIGWSIFYLVDADAAAFDVLYWSAVAVVMMFTLGIAPRLTGILTWVVVVSAIANPATTYDADYLLAILAFYLMIAYVGYGLWNGPTNWP
ncbi:MAG: hypothetical protein NZO58_11445, partial [Gemmataceae bacterium]|nr:hypothetical protein [Gemmataceae bacterium]